MKLATLKRILKTTDDGHQFYKPKRNVARGNDFAPYRGLAPSAAELTRRQA